MYRDCRASNSFRHLEAWGKKSFRRHKTALQLPRVHSAVGENEAGGGIAISQLRLQYDTHDDVLNDSPHSDLEYTFAYFQLLVFRNFDKGPRPRIHVSPRPLVRLPVESDRSQIFQSIVLIDRD
jgi:hypothetical protein